MQAARKLFASPVTTHDNTIQVCVHIPTVDGRYTPPKSTVHFMTSPRSPITTSRTLKRHTFRGHTLARKAVCLQMPAHRKRAYFYFFFQQAATAVRDKQSMVGFSSQLNRAQRFICKHSLRRTPPPHPPRWPQRVHAPQEVHSKKKNT
jgi:hypothetical protein